MITAREVHAAEFRRAAAGKPGYDEVAVDDFLDRVIETLVAVEGNGAMPQNPVTSAEVVDIEFSERHIDVEGGYDLDDVDDLLDEVAKRLFASEQSVGVDVPLSDAPSSDGHDVAGPEGFDQTGRADDAVRGDRFVDDTPAVPELSDENTTREGDRDSGGVEDASALAAAAGAPVTDRTEMAQNVAAPSDETAAPETGVAEATNSDPVTSDAEARGVRIVAVGPVVEESRGERVADDAAPGRVDEPTETRPSDDATHADQVTRSQGWFSDGPVGPVAEASDEDAADFGSTVEPDAGSERPGDASSAVGSSQDAPRINMVGGDPLPETSDDTSEAGRAASEPVHRVGSDPDDARDNHGDESPRSHHEAADAAAERDEAMSPQVVRDVDGHDVLATASVDDDVTDREPAFADAAVGADNENVVAAGPSDEDVTDHSVAGSDAGFDSADSDADEARSADADAEQPAPTSAASVVVNDPGTSAPRTMGESWGDGVGAEEPLPGVAEEAAPDAEKSASPLAVDSSSADESASVDATGEQPGHAVSQSDWAPSEVSQGGPQFVSYPATDHRVPLPRTEIRRHMSDADREAEAQYHPEFSSYATPDIEMALPEPALPDLDVEQLDTAQPAELQAVDALTPAAITEESAMSEPMNEPSDQSLVMPEAQPEAFEAAGRVAPANEETAGERPQRDPETVGNPPPPVAAELARRAAARDAERADEQASGIGRPEPIDAPSAIGEVETPESIDAPKPLPPREDTSRKGILRRIFKG